MPQIAPESISPGYSAIPVIGLSLDISHVPTGVMARTLNGLMRHGVPNAAIHSVLSNDRDNLSAIPEGVARILDTRRVDVCTLDTAKIDRNSVDMVIMNQRGAWSSEAVRLGRKGIAACVALEADQSTARLDGAVRQALGLQPFAYPRFLTSVGNGLPYIDTAITTAMHEHRHPGSGTVWFPNPNIKAPNVYVEQFETVEAVPTTIANGEASVRIIVPLEREVVEDGVLSVVAYLAKQVPDLRTTQPAV